MDTVRFLLPFCRPYSKQYFLGILLQPLSIASLLAIPYLTGEAVGKLEMGAAQEILTIVWWILGCSVVRGISLFATRYLLITASRAVEFDLRNSLFGHLQSLDQLFFKRSHAGDLMARMASDVDRTRLIIGPVIMYSVSTICMLVFAIPLMLSLSWKLTVLIMLPLSLLTLIVRFIGPRVHTQMLKAQETLSKLSSHSQENFAGVRVVKSFAQETSETERFSRSARRYADENLKAAMYSAWMHPLIGGVGDLGQIFIILVGGILILYGQLGLPELIKFTGYLLALLWPMLSIGWVVNQYQRGAASVHRIRELLDQKPQIASPPEPSSAPSGKIQGHVSIRKLTFSYGRTEVLRDVSIEVPLGHTIAIVGRTGSGKSTLVSLIPRIYPVPDDTVFVDGFDINRYPLSELRRSIGFVPQESFLFSRSISRNIAFASDELDHEKIHSIAELTRLANDVDQFPKGYEEVVGERGVTLSGGQRQRAALARALAIDPRILILDDALSAVDTQTEEEILAGLKRFTENLTTIIVSHRISSIQHADRIYVIDEGVIIEQGTHDELVRHDGIYAEIHRLQLISDELENM